MEDRVYMKHCRAVGFCSKGVKIFLSNNGFDFKDFLLHGIDAEELLVLDQGQATKAVEYMRGYDGVK